MFGADHISQICFEAHFVQECVMCMEPFQYMYYLPMARFRLALLFLFLPLPQEYHSQKIIFVMELCSPMMQKVNKKMLSQSIVSVTSALIGALVICGFITLTHFFCSCPCLLLLGIFSALVSGLVYIVSLTYPVLQLLHQMTGIYQVSIKISILGTEEQYKIKVSAIT